MTGASRSLSSSAAAGPIGVPGRQSAGLVPRPASSAQPAADRVQQSPAAADHSRAAAARPLLPRARRARATRLSCSLADPCDVAWAHDIYGRLSQKVQVQNIGSTHPYDPSPLNCYDRDVRPGRERVPPRASTSTSPSSTLACVPCAPWSAARHPRHRSSASRSPPPDTPPAPSSACRRPVDARGSGAVPVFHRRHHAVERDRDCHRLGRQGHVGSQ